MKKTLLTLALIASFAASAQTTVDSTSGSNSNAGAASGSSSAVQSQNSGNTSVTATGNEAASRSVSGSQSGALSGSTSGAAGNIINLDQSVPSQQTLHTTVNGSTTSNNTTNGTVNENVKYSGTVENRTSGGTYDRSDTNVNYSGTQTIKNVPSIAMSGPASGPCTGASGGLGLAGPGWGVGLNGSAVMVDCRLRENLRVIGMAMQSLDGTANPQEKGEATVMFMDAFRGLAAYNNQLLAAEVKQAK